MDFQPLEPREMNSCCLGHLVHGLSLMAAQLTHTEDGDFVGGVCGVQSLGTQPHGNILHPTQMQLHRTEWKQRRSPTLLAITTLEPRKHSSCVAVPKTYQPFTVGH